MRRRGVGDGLGKESGGDAAAVGGGSEVMHQVDQGVERRAPEPLHDDEERGEDGHQGEVGRKEVPAQEEGDRDGCQERRGARHEPEHGQDLEGEEELGGPSIATYVRANPRQLAADCVLILDTGMVARGVPTITYGLRGIITFEITAHGAAHGLPSGL